MEKTKYTVTNELTKASEFIQSGEIADAIVLLRQILDKEPDNELPLGMLAAIYLQTGMLQKAEILYQNLLDKHPQNPLARFQLGMLYLGSNEPDKALTVWAPLLKDAHNFMAYFHSALAHLQLNNAEEAYKMLDTAQSAMPKSHPLHPQLIELMASRTN